MRDPGTRAATVPVGCGDARAARAARAEQRRASVRLPGRIALAASLIAVAACAREAGPGRFNYDAVSADPAAFYGTVRPETGAGTAGSAPVTAGAGLREEDALDRMRERARPGQINRALGEGGLLRGANATIDQAAAADRSGDVRRQTLQRQETALGALRVQGEDRTTPSGNIGDQRRRAVVEVDRLRRQDVLERQREEALTATQRRGVRPSSTVASDASEALRRDMRRAFERQRVNRPGRIGGALPDIGAYEGPRP